MSSIVHPFHSFIVSRGIISIKFNRGWSSSSPWFSIRISYYRSSSFVVSIPLGNNSLLLFRAGDSHLSKVLPLLNLCHWNPLSSILALSVTQTSSHLSRVSTCLPQISFILYVIQRNCNWIILNPIRYEYQKLTANSVSQMVEYVRKVTLLLSCSMRTYRNRHVCMSIVADSVILTTNESHSIQSLTVDIHVFDSIIIVVIRIRDEIIVTINRFIYFSSMILPEDSEYSRDESTRHRRHVSCGKKIRSKQDKITFEQRSICPFRHHRNIDYNVSHQPLSTLIYVFPQMPKVSHFNVEGAHIRRLLTCLCPLTYSLQLRGYNLIRLSFSVFLFYWKKFDVSVIVLLIFLPTLMFDVNLYSTKYPSSGGSFPFLLSFPLSPSSISSVQTVIQWPLRAKCRRIDSSLHSSQTSELFPLPHSFLYLHHFQRDDSSDFMVDIANWFNFQTYLIISSRVFTLRIISIHQSFLSISYCRCEYIL